MTIEEIQEAKKTLTTAITTLIQDFNKSSPVHVERIDVQNQTYYSDGFSRGIVTELASVEITLGKI